MDVHNNNIYLIKHHLSNKKYPSIQMTLTEVYNKIFDLQIQFTDSYCYDSEIHLQKLPALIYGVNQVKYQNFHVFFKRLTQDNESTFIDKKNLISTLEKLIFTDLQLILSLYAYYNRKDENIFDMNKIYSPIISFYTYKNDIEFIQNIRKVLKIKNKEEILDRINEINESIENYLTLEDILNISLDTIKSIDLAIYSAYKTQFIYLREKISKYEKMKILSDTIDNIINKVKRKEINLLPSNYVIISKL
jgi:hypothetical protein